jgi:hypothetical protein
MKIKTERYNDFDRLLYELTKGMAFVAFVGVSISLFAALWGIINSDRVIPGKRIALSPVIASFEHAL